MGTACVRVFKGRFKVEVCVIGAGYVGLVTSCSLAYLGNRVTVIEANADKLQTLQTGQVPFFEPGLAELMEQVVKSGRLTFADSISLGVKNADVIFIAVGTPPQPSGEPDMTQVTTVARAIGGALDAEKKRVIVNKSTVPVGSGNWVEMLVQQGLMVAVPAQARGATTKSDEPPFAVVSNPEFLREGQAIHDTFYPDRIVLGSGDDQAADLMRLLYKPITEQSFEPPKCAPRPRDLHGIPLIVTDLASAEMIKYSANAFLAMKISFANEMANICEKVGADIRQVAQGIGLDKRIGTQFLSAGVGWGGSCFGKDVNALIDVAREYNCTTSLLEATLAVNKYQRTHVITMLQEELKIIKGRTVGLLGLSFKPNTDDLRDAPSLSIAAQLHKMGAAVRAYDPVSNETCKRQHPELPIVYCEDVADVARGADALILVTEWPEFREVKWQDIAGTMKKAVIVDGRNYLAEQSLTGVGFRYRGIGR